MSDKSDLENGRLVYLRLLGYVKPYRVAFVFAILGMTIVAGTEVGFAYIMEPLLDGTFVQKDPTMVTLVPIAILIIFLVRGVGSFCVTYFMAWVGRHVVKDLRREMFEHLLTLPVSFFDRQPSGKLISKLIYDVEQLSAASSHALTVLIQDSLTLIALLSFMFYKNWQLTLLFLTVGPALTLIVVYINKRLRKTSRLLQNSVGDVTHISQETIEANRVVKIFGGQEYERERFERVNQENRRQYMKMIVTHASSVPVTQFLAAALLAVIVFLATRPELQDQITVGVFMAFITAMLLLFPPLKRLMTVNVELQKGIAAAQSVFNFTGESREKDEGKHRLERAEGAVEFENVTFSYDREKGDVLKGVSIQANPGEVVALVGRSGSGKSTLASLISRFYAPSSGHIRLDGIDINDIALTDLRTQISLVSQDVFLFNDTIEHNIAYGRQGGAHTEVSRDAVIEAARSAYAWEFISQMPDGLDTEVGEHGVLVSGGQRQRLAIARALLKDAPILILDEATSALDTESEREVQKALERLMEGRTTFVIAHRLSTIENADKIVVLHDGRVVEVGTHQVLLEKRGHYAALYELQFGSNSSG